MSANLQKLHKLVEARALLESGMTQSAVAFALNISSGTLSKWLAAASSSQAVCGEDAPPSRGRTKAIELTLEEQHKAKFHVLCCDESIPLGMRCVLADEAIRPEIRAAIAGYFAKAEANKVPVSFPKSLVQSVRPTAEEKAMFRGKKAWQNFELSITRGLFVIEDGRERPLRPNDVWESDDMSINQPFKFWDEDLGRYTVGRQGLYTIDVMTHKWLGHTLVGRPNDAYRAEDIADHFLDLVTQWGLPKVWRLERGTWEGTFIHGIKTKARPEYRWGALAKSDKSDGIIQVDHTWKSRGKGTVENGFCHLQALMTNHSLDIGRERGENEFAAREFRRAQQGQTDALARFWDIETAANATHGAMSADNAALKRRLALGKKMVRADDFDAIRTIAPCPQSELWRFCPVKKELTCRNGKVTCQVPHYPTPFEFVINGNLPHGGYVPNGTILLVAFHPARPYEGAHIFCGLEKGDVRNRGGWRFGELICIAEPLVHAPQVIIGAGELYTDQQTRANAAVRTEYRATVARGQHPSLRKSGLSDKFGTTFYGVENEAENADGIEKPYAPSPAPAKKPAKNKGATAIKAKAFKRAAVTQQEIEDLLFG